MPKITIAVVGPRKMGEPVNTYSETYPVWRNISQVKYGFLVMDTVFTKLFTKLKKKDPDFDPFSSVLFKFGGAAGADEIGRLWAQRNQFNYRVFPAKWKKHGKAAGPIRNREFLPDTDYMLAFWDNEGRGTADAISIARSQGSKVKVIDFTSEVPYLF